MKTIYEIHEAIQALTPQAKFSVTDNDIDQIEWMDDDIAQPTVEQINAQIAIGQAALDANLYRSQRKVAYPQIGEQLDMLYHAIDADASLQTQFADFYAAIKAVKDANPKP